MRARQDGFASRPHVRGHWIYYPSPRLHTALGAFSAAGDRRQRSAQLVARLPSASHASAVLVTAVDEWRMATDAGWGEPIGDWGPGFGTGMVREWYRASVDAARCRTLARLGRFDHTVERLPAVIPAIQRAQCWAPNYAKLTADAAETLWLSTCTDHVEDVEAGLRSRVLAPNLFYPMVDGCLSLARLCALQGRHTEPAEWFARACDARRPGRATVAGDHRLRRGANVCAPRRAGDGERTRTRLQAAVEQFRAIGMPGWIRRAEALTSEPPRRVTQVAVAVLTPTPARLCAEGDLCSIEFEGRVIRLRHSRGLTLLAQLLRAPGREIAAIELVGGACGRTVAEVQPVRGTLSDASELLDAPARTAHKRRVTELRQELV